MGKRVFIFLLVILLTIDGLSGGNTADKMEHKNKKKIEKIMRILRETVRDDIITIFKWNSASLDANAEIVSRIFDYLDHRVSLIYIDTRNI